MASKMSPIQLPQRGCKCCKESYLTKWFKTKDGDTCFFCTNFLPMRDTKTTILNAIDHHFLWSGEDSRKEYYNSFLDGLNVWCDHWHVSTSTADKTTEETLRKVQDWSREYWH